MRNCGASRSSAMPQAVGASSFNNVFRDWEMSLPTAFESDLQHLGQTFYLTASAKVSGRLIDVGRALEHRTTPMRTRTLGALLPLPLESTKDACERSGLKERSESSLEFKSLKLRVECQYSANRKSQFGHFPVGIA